MTNRPEYSTLILRNTMPRTACVVALFCLLTMFAMPAAEAQTFQALHTFTGGMDGGYPNAGLTMDSGGNLYGTTAISSPSGGTAYRLQRAGTGWTFNILRVPLDPGEVYGSLGRLSIGPDGALYGTATGQSDNGGEVFKLQPSPTFCRAILCPWTETVLYTFSDLTTGNDPSGDLAVDQSGDIFGTTYYGGVPNGGVVYEVAHSGSNYTEAVLHAFTGPDGTQPWGGVALGSDGNLYGTTVFGGASNVGVIFQLVPSNGSWTENVLYNFEDGGDGGYPQSSVVFDSAGNIYGTTSNGGSGGGGTIFELSPSGDSWNYTVLYSLDSSGGTLCGPQNSTLKIDGAGNLYGTTYCDGTYGLGNVFELSLSNGTWTYTDLYDFTGGADGRWPTSNVTIDHSGNLYGTAVEGGAGTCYRGCGTVWKITP